MTTPTRTTDEAFWNELDALAAAGIDAEKAFRKVRISVGGDLIPEKDFVPLYNRMVAEPLFRRFQVLTMKRASLKLDMLTLAWRVNCPNDNAAEELVAIMDAVDKGSAQGYFDLLEALEFYGHVDETAELRTRFTVLWEKINRDYIAKNAAVGNVTASTPIELVEELPGLQP